LTNILIHGASGSIGNLLYLSLKKNRSNNTLGTFYSNNSDKSLTLFPHNQEDMACLQKRMDTIILSASPHTRIKSHNQNTYINNYTRNMELSLNSLSSKNKLVIMLSSATTYHESDNSLSEKDIDYKKKVSPSYKNIAKALKKIEILTQEKCKHLSINFLILRITSVYGCDSKGTILPGVIPDLLKKFSDINKQLIYLYGSSSSKRNFINIHDVIEIIVNIIDREDLYNNIINVCSNDNIKLQELVHIILDIIKINKKFQFESNSNVNSRAIHSDFTIIKKKIYLSLSKGIKDIFIHSIK